MQSGTFERIEHHRPYPAHVFITDLQTSGFHWHHDYELLVVLEGTLRVHAGPEPSILGAGDIMLINSRMMHGMRAVDHPNLCLFIQFAPQLFGQVLGNRQTFRFYLNSTWSRFRPQVPFARFVRTAACIGLASRLQGPAAELRTMAHLQTLLADLVEYVQYDILQAPALGTEDDTLLLAQINSYIGAHLSSASLGTDLCREVGMSPKSMYRYLTRTLGLTLKSLIDDARIERAKALLRGGDGPLAVIAGVCGFASESTFYRSFKRETGLTPSDYRQYGLDTPNDPEIRDYLGYDPAEALRLLQQYAD